MVQYYPREVTSLWRYDGPLAQLYPDTDQTLPQTIHIWGNEEPLNFFSFVWTVMNCNPFQRWFSEVAPVSWHINFISRSYGWGVRARFNFWLFFTPLDYNIYLQRECCKTSFICCFIVTAKNSIWPVAFLFFWSWWSAEK